MNEIGIYSVDFLSTQNAQLNTLDQILDGINMAGRYTMAILLTGQDNPVENGPYIMAEEGQPWVRMSPFDDATFQSPGHRFYVKAGYWSDTTWKLLPSSEVMTLLIGDTEISFSMADASYAKMDAGAALEIDDSGFITHSDSNVTPGTFQSPGLVTVNSMGHITNIESGSMGASFIEGLSFSLSDETFTRQLDIQPGAAFIEGLGRYVELPEGAYFNADGDILSNLCYIYLTWASGTAYIELSATPPAYPYSGNARSMTGQPLSRYIGTLATDESGSPYECSAEGHASSLFVTYTNPIDSRFRVVSAANGQLAQMVAAGASDKKLVPVSCRSAWCRVNTNGSSGAVIGLSGPESTKSQGPVTVRASSEVYAFVPLTDEQWFYWRNLSSGGSTNVWVNGYWDRR